MTTTTLITRLTRALFGGPDEARIPTLGLLAEQAAAIEQDVALMLADDVTMDRLERWVAASFEMVEDARWEKLHGDEAAWVTEAVANGDDHAAAYARRLVSTATLAIAAGFRYTIGGLWTKEHMLD